VSQVRLIRIKEEILASNRGLAATLRSRLHAEKTLLLNLMSSPGSGKTSLILRTIDALRGDLRIAVIEADLDSTVDSDKVAAAGIEAVQIDTGGFCHVDAAMASRAVEELAAQHYDLLLIENVGNLVCPAQSDTGAHVNAVILSVPEGDDKPLKYPPAFASADIVVLNKVDYLSVADFDTVAFSDRVRSLNAGTPICQLSCKTGAGLDCWIEWVRSRAAEIIT
jgi:hydrogenase nickel incorporation protein HypB